MDWKCNNQEQRTHRTTSIGSDGNNSQCHGLLKIWVQEFPKANSLKSRETDRVSEMKGIVMRMGECRPIRQSGGTQ